jgi:hypothetical protein
MNRKGDGFGPGSVAGLIFLIAIFIVLYVLVLPPCDKCQLLKTECPSSCGAEVIREDNVLLYESVGEVSAFGVNENVKSLDDVDLFFDPEPYTKRLATAVYVSSGFFGENDKSLDFKLDNLDNIESASLMLDVVKSKGKLIVELNGYTVFFDKVDAPTLKIINLPVEYLEENNHIKIYSESPGLAIWAKNYVNINDVVLKLQFNKISAKEDRYFSISSLEKSELLGSRVEFYIYCEEAGEDFSVFKLFLNDEIVYREFLECKGEDKIIALDRSKIQEGVNQLVFAIDSGRFILSNIRVVNSFINNINPSYDFEVSREIISKDVYLRIEFENGDRKEADIIINDNIVRLDTSNEVFEKKINDYVKEGRNVIEIKPEVDFNIKGLKIWYE